MSKAYQVVGIGNAVSDVIATSSDDFLAEHGVEKDVGLKTRRSIKAKTF